MFQKIWQKIKSLKTNRKAEEIGQLRDILLINLNTIDQKMTREITNLAVQSCSIQRQMKILHRDKRYTRDEMIKCDNRAIAFEEGIYQRMEIRHIIRQIMPILEKADPVTDKFLDREYRKDNPESWIFYLNSLSPDKKFDQTCDYSELHYVLAILKEDLSEFSSKNGQNRSEKDPSPQEMNSDKTFSIMKPF